MYPSIVTPGRKQLMKTDLTSRPMTDLQRRRQLCDDLEYCVVHDKELLSIVIDEFVYRLNDNEVKDFEAEVNKILGEDD